MLFAESAVDASILRMLQLEHRNVAALFGADPLPRMAHLAAGYSEPFHTRNNGVVLRAEHLRDLNRGHAFSVVQIEKKVVTIGDNPSQDCRMQSRVPLAAIAARLSFSRGVNLELKLSRT